MLSYSSDLYRDDLKGFIEELLKHDFIFLLLFQDEAPIVIKKSGALNPDFYLLSFSFCFQQIAYYRFGAVQSK